MEEKWYEGLSDDAFLSEENKAYKRIIEKITGAVKNGMGFEDACNSVDMEDAETKSLLINDALRVLIAEMHFVQKMPTDIVAEKLGIPVERVNSTRDSMIEEIKETAIKTFNSDVSNYQARP